MRQRLLRIGLPLTIPAGFGAARLLFPGLMLVEAAILATMLAPTDGALGEALVTNPAVPSATREGLNVESRPNDGIYVPILFTFLALATESHGSQGTGALALRLVGEEIGIGLAVGGGLTLLASQALLAGAEGTGSALVLVPWVTFGAAVVDRFVGSIGPATLLYAVLSLTLVRMVPVFLSVAGVGLRADAKLFIGWLGPRGLASIVFAVIVANEHLSGSGVLSATVVCTVVLSILAHGLSAKPLPRPMLESRGPDVPLGDLRGERDFREQEPPMDLYDAMSTLRAVRRLRADPIPEDVLERVLQAATWAPTGGNAQPWRIVLVRDPPLRAELAALYKRRWQTYVESYASRTSGVDATQRARLERTLAAGDHLAGHLGSVPAIAVFCYKPSLMAITDASLPRPSVVGGASVYPAVQNLLLACRNEGLGCVLTTLLCLDEPRVKELLGIPEDWYTCAHVPVGYPVGGGHGPIHRRPVRKMVWADRWGTAYRT